MQFHSYRKDIFRIIKKHWSLLKRAYPQIEDSQHVPMKAYRRNKTLRDSLVRSEYKPREQEAKMTFMSRKRKGCFPCPNCIQCSLIMKGNHYVHPDNSEKIMVKGYHTSVLLCSIHAIMPLQFNIRWGDHTNDLG